MGLALSNILAKLGLLPIGLGSELGGFGFNGVYALNIEKLLCKITFCKIGPPLRINSPSLTVTPGDTFKMSTYYYYVCK